MSRSFKTISYEEAKEYFAKSTRAIKDTDTDQIKAQVGDKLLSIIPSRLTYTISPLRLWDLDMVFNPDSDAYMRDKAFMLETKDLVLAIKQNAKDENLIKNITTRINMTTNTDGAKYNHEIDKFGKFLNTNRDFKGDENVALFQTLKMMDKALMDENNKEFKAVYEKIGLDFTDIDGKQIQINAMLGEGHFQKDLDHLTKIGCNDCEVGNVSNVANNLFIKATELKEPTKTQNEQNKQKQQNKNLEFKNPATLDNFEKCLKGGLEATAVLAESIGDESITAFTQNLNRVAGISGLSKILPQNKNHKSKDIQNDERSKAILERIGEAYTKKIQSGDIKLPKEKVMEHSNKKNLGASR